MQKNKNIFAAARNALDGVKELIKEKSARRELALAIIAIVFFCFIVRTR